MELYKYEGKKVKIIAHNGKSYSGLATDYFEADDNVSGEEGLAVLIDGRLIEFSPSDITSIEESEEAK